MTDNDDVLRQARDAVPHMHMDTPVETIMARGSARRRRRLVRASVAGTGAAAAAAVAVVGLLGAGATPPARANGTIRTAAFTLVRNSNGTDTLTLTQDQVFDPAALQQALAQDGIPAMVKTGEFCTSHPALYPNGVISLQLPDGQPAGASGPVPPDAVTVINPAALPAGTEITFGFFRGGRTLTAGVVYQDSYTCSPNQPTGGPSPSGGSGASGPSGNS